MEQENLEQTREKRIEPKIRVSRDSKWVIETIPIKEIELFMQDHPGSDVVIIKPVRFWDKVISPAKASAGYDIKQIKS